MIKHFAACLWAEKSKLIYILILLALSVVSFWDTFWILDAYINDNRLTLVNIKTVQDKFPFLENVSVQICFDFRGSDVFPESWQRDLTDEEVNMTTVDIDDMTNLNVRDNFHAAYLFSQIRDMDARAIECAVIGFNGSCDVLLAEMYSPIQTYTENGTVLAHLQDALWEQVHPSLVWRRSYDLSPNTTDFTLGIMNISYLCIDLHLHRFLHLQVPAFEYLIGPVGTRAFVTNATVAPIVEIFGPSFVSPTFILGRNGRTDVFLNIANLGVYDISDTTPCSTIPRPTRIKKFDDMHPELHCMPKRYFDAVITYCQCIPFTYHRQFSIYQSTDSNQILPFCTPNTYKTCIEKARVALEDNPPCLPPCLTANNQISVTMTSSSAEVFEVSDNYQLKEPVFSRSRIVFQCKVTSYALNEEHFQLTITQLIAQVGGDIGLYTGISMLGIWHFIIQVFSWCKLKRHKEGDIEMGAKRKFTGVSWSPHRGPRAKFWSFSKEEENVNSPLEVRVTELESYVRALKEEMKCMKGCNFNGNGEV